ncbi:MAG: hypothetical protein AAF414_16265 [Pseudomonadota bacterium]
MAEATALNTPSPRRSPVGEYRAFEVFDHIPAGCQLQLVRDDRHDPHLRMGEWAVVDANDREIQLNEVFAVLQSGGINLWQICPDHHKPLPVDEGQETFWLRPLDNIRGATKEERAADVERRFAERRLHVSDGPIYGWALREKIVGRVVGIFQGNADSRNLAHERDQVAALPTL